jgi:hypothetical protein
LEADDEGGDDGEIEGRRVGRLRVESWKLRVESEE